MVKGSEDTTYKRLNSQLESLVKQYTEENVQFAGSSYRYIVSYSISQFEDAFQTKIEIDKSKNGKDYVFAS